MAQEVMIPERNVKQEYEKLIGNRTECLRRARNNSAFTIPAIMPEEGHTETTRLPEPWQSVGARGINNLTSRILMTLFPPNTANWRGTISPSKLIESGLSPEEVSEFDAALSGLEQEFRRNFEASGDRSILFELLQTHLISGDVFARFLENGKLRYYRLDQFGCERDLDGNLLKAIFKETVAFIALPDELRAAIKGVDDMGKPRDKVDVYTVIQRVEGKRLEEAQYIDGLLVDGSEGVYPDMERAPWRDLRHTKIPGENHGRAFMDDLLPDLKSLDSLTESVVQGIALAVKTILFVRPGSPIARDKLQKAKNGDVLSGSAEDVTILRIEKQADLNVAINMLERLEQRLGMSFLMNTSIQRNAERVTAAEIRFMAAELEAALGGFYSRLATDLQVWYIRQRLDYMVKKKEAPSLPTDLFNIQIITGVDALGRRAELDSLDQFIMGLAEQFGPDTLVKVVSINEYIRRRASALGIDTRSLVKTEAETQQSADEQGANELIAGVAPEVVRQAGPLLTQQPPEGQA